MFSLVVNNPNCIDLPCSIIKKCTYYIILDPGSFTDLLLLIDEYWKLASLIWTLVIIPCFIQFRIGTYKGCSKLETFTFSEVEFIAFGESLWQHC